MPEKQVLKRRKLDDGTELVSLQVDEIQVNNTSLDKEGTLTVKSVVVNDKDVGQALTDINTSLSTKATSTALANGLRLKANLSHNHDTSNITGLDQTLTDINTALDTKAASSGSLSQNFNADELKANSLEYKSGGTWTSVADEFAARPLNETKSFEITSKSPGWYEIASTIWNASGWFRIWLRDEVSDGTGGHRHSLIALRVHQCYNDDQQTTVIEKLPSAYYQQQDILKARVVQRNKDTNSLAWFTNTHDSYLQIYIRPGILREESDTGEFTVFQRLYIEQVAYTGFGAAAKWVLKSNLQLSATEATSGFTSVDLDFTDKYGYIVNQPLQATALLTDSVATGSLTTLNASISTAGQITGKSLNVESGSISGGTLTGTAVNVKNGENTNASITTAGAITGTSLVASGDVECTDVVASSSIKTPSVKVNNITQLAAKNFSAGQLNTSPDINGAHYYGIAKLSKDPRPVGSARFQLVLSSSGIHQSIEFIATVMHDKSNITVLNSTAYEDRYIVTSLDIVYDEDSEYQDFQHVYGTKILRIRVFPLQVEGAWRWKLSEFYVTLTKFGEGGIQNEWELLNVQLTTDNYSTRTLHTAELGTYVSILPTAKAGNWAIRGNDIIHTSVGKDGQGGRALVGLNESGTETLYVNYAGDFDRVVVNRQKQRLPYTKGFTITTDTFSPQDVQNYTNTYGGADGHGLLYGFTLEGDRYFKVPTGAGLAIVTNRIRNLSIHIQSSINLGHLYNYIFAVDYGGGIISQVSNYLILHMLELTLQVKSSGSWVTVARKHGRFVRELDLTGNTNLGNVYRGGFELERAGDGISFGEGMDHAFDYLLDLTANSGSDGFTLDEGYNMRIHIMVAPHFKYVYSGITAHGSWFQRFFRNNTTNVTDVIGPKVEVNADINFDIIHEAT